MKKHILLIILFISINSFNNLFGQAASLFDIPWAAGRMNLQSPSIASLGTYGDIENNLYTGTPNINIPLYSLEIANQNIPITLNYNTNNVKPNTHPGIVGLGWSFSCGGSITRHQKERVDEDGYIYKGGQKIKFGYQSKGYTYSQGDNWSKEYYLHQLSSDKGLGFDVYDYTPDEFYFNFLGYSGSFSLDHTGKWQVISDTKFKIQNEIDIFSNARYPINKAGDIYTIMKFELIAPDGTTFIFGGKNSIDYSISYYAMMLDIRYDYPVATSWHLSQIITPNGQSINFINEPVDPIISVDVAVNHQNVFKKPTLSWFTNVQLVHSCLLKSITYGSSEIIKLFYKNTIEKDYHPEIVPEIGSNYILIDNITTWNRNPLIDSYSKIKWKQLDQIVVGKGFKYLFNYTSNKNERLKLLSIEKINQNNSTEETEKYSFNYNANQFPNYWSGHGDHLGFYNGKDYAFLFQNGFLNGFFNDGVLENCAEIYAKSRIADISGEYVKSEILERITYPTGGYTMFEYEPHFVLQQVIPGSAPRIMPFYPGGIRLKRIKNFISNGNFANSKSYYYKSNFNPVSKSGQDSGILSYVPSYYWNFRLTDFGAWEILDRKFNLFTTDGMHNMSHSVPGYYVGYSSVIECQEDKNENINGYKEYKFTNFDRDIWGTSHHDEAPISMLNNEYHPWYSGTSLFRTPYSYYTPITSKSMERGKLISEKIFDQQNNLKKETYYKYEKSSDNYIRGISIYISPIITFGVVTIYHVNGSIDSERQETGHKGRFALGGAYKIYTYQYLLKEKTETIYEDDQQVSINTNYLYNSNNLVISEKINYGNSNNVENKIKYTGDLIAEYENSIGVPIPNNPVVKVYDIMKDRHMISYPVEKIKLKNDKVVSATINTFRYSNGMILPSENYNLSISSPILDYSSIRISSPNTLHIDNRNRRNLCYQNYDSYGNPVYLTKMDEIPTVYLWSYNGQYPIAEIKGATYDQVKGGISESILNTISSKDEPTSLDWTVINSLRVNPAMVNAHVTTYTYKPLVGMTSATDPSGKTTYYEYDSFNRLKRTYIKETTSDNTEVERTLQSHDYHYYNQ